MVGPIPAPFFKYRYTIPMFKSVNKSLNRKRQQKCESRRVKEKKRKEKKI